MAIIMLGQRSGLTPDLCSRESEFVSFLSALISTPGLSGADFAMKVTNKNYFDTRVSAFFSTTERTIGRPHAFFVN
jgi:hypothetical protein